MKKLILSLLIFNPLCAQEMKDLLPSNPVIFDVGAHVGNKAKHYLQLGARQVVCIEPQPACLEVLTRKFRADPRVVIFSGGLSDKRGTIPFFICSDATTISTATQDWQEGRFKNYVWDQKIEIPVITFDELIEKHGIPDFCKIDVEGYEYQVLQGLTRPIPYLSFEFAYEHLEKKTKPCLDHLTQLGLNRFNVAYGDNEVFALEEWVTAETLFTILKDNPDKLAWGDVYGRY